LWLTSAARTLSGAARLHNDIFNVARIDGAGATGILTRVMLPISTPVLAVVAIFTVMINLDIELMTVPTSTSWTWFSRLSPPYHTH